MASTTRPPLAEGVPEQTQRTYVDEEASVTTALREEGDVPQSSAITLALRAGRDAASRLMRETPARLALKEAGVAAASGRRVAFVTERADDAVAARAGAPSNFLVVGRRDACAEIERHHPDLLVVACRATDAVRLLAEISEAPAEVRMVFAPDQAATAAQIAAIAAEWPEMSEISARCHALLRAMPPSFARIMRFGTVLERRQRSGSLLSGANRAGGGGRVDHARAEVVVAFDDDEGDVPFAPGAVVVVLSGGEPYPKRAAELKSADLVVLPPEDISDSIAREMGWAGEQELLDDAVRRYKQSVGAWVRGAGSAVSVATIIERMRRVDPGMPEPSSSTVRYWLSAAESEDKPTPHASEVPRWFAAFCEVIGHCDPGTSELARHFEAHRGRLRHEGHVRRCLVERFLFDRYVATVQQRVPIERVAALRTRALSHVRTVTGVERGGLWEGNK